VSASWEKTWALVADSIAGRSGCSVRQVGAVIVAEDNGSHWVGYSGAPGGYTEAMGLTKPNGCASYCPQGACSPTEPRWAQAPGDEDRPCVAIHAEINALMKSDPHLRKGGTAFVTVAPCWKCALALANSGIRRLVSRDWEPVREALAYDIRNVYSKLGLEISQWPHQ
jgi:deoxycytidylate deaminase